MSHVIVVGGGITGLTAAWTLHQAGADVVVCEASDLLGGKLASGTVAGHRVEVGADAFLTRDFAAASLARQLGLGDDLVAPATGRAWLWIDGRLRAMPAGTVLGAPADLAAVARSRVLPPVTLARAAMDAVLPRRHVPGDRSVADVVGERFGQAVVDRLVEPLLGGIYAGRPDELSVEATTPAIAAAARGHRRLARGLRAHRRRSSGGGGAAFLTLAGGLDQLTQCISDELGDRVHTDTAVVSLSSAGGGWQVHTAGGARLDAAQVVLTAPAGPTASMIGDVAPTAAAELGEIAYASVALFTLAYPRSADAQLPDGSGMLVPRTEGRLIKAATFVSRKWPHHDTGKHVLIRASVGRIDDHAWRDLDPDDLAQRVDAEVRTATGITVPADDRLVTVWEHALPQYRVGHLDRVDRIRAALPAGLHVAGAACDGIGITPCVASAQRAAAAVLA